MTQTSQPTLKAFTGLAVVFARITAAGTAGAADGDGVGSMKVEAPLAANVGRCPVVG